MKRAVITTSATTSWTTRIGLLSSGAGPGSRGGSAGGACFSVSVMAALTLPAVTQRQASVQGQAGSGPGLGIVRQHRVDLVHLVVHPGSHRLGHHIGDAAPRQRMAQEGLDSHLV